MIFKIITILFECSTISSTNEVTDLESKQIRESRKAVKSYKEFENVHFDEIYSKPVESERSILKNIDSKFYTSTKVAPLYEKNRYSNTISVSVPYLQTKSCKIKIYGNIDFKLHIDSQDGEIALSFKNKKSDSESINCKDNIQPLNHNIYEMVDDGQLYSKVNDSKVNTTKFNDSKVNNDNLNTDNVCSKVIKQETEMQEPSANLNDKCTKRSSLEEKIIINNKADIESEETVIKYESKNFAPKYSHTRFCSYSNPKQRNIKNNLYLKNNYDSSKNHLNKSFFSNRLSEMEDNIKNQSECEELDKAAFNSFKNETTRFTEKLTYLKDGVLSTTEEFEEIENVTINPTFKLNEKVVSHSYSYNI